MEVCRCRGPINIDVEDVLTVNDTDLLLSAACEGVGLAYLVDDVVAPFLEKGDLIRVLEPWCKPFRGFYFYYSERTHMPASLRALIDFMKVTSR
jgi:DNA-binding transcriptional LysR family regulator